MKSPVGTKGFPDRRTVLLGVFAVRLLVAFGGLSFAALGWTERPDVSFLVAVMVLLTLTMTAYGWYVLFVRRFDPGPSFLYVQAGVDLTLVTTLVHFAGQGAAAVASLYVVVIAANSLLLPVAGGALVTAASVVLYLAADVWGRAAAGATVLGGQAAVFGFVFLVVGVLGHRLRTATVEQSQLEGELRRVRLEADEILRNIRSGVLTVNGHGRLAFINPTAERLLEIRGEELLGHPVMELLEGRAPELHAAIEEGLSRGGRVSRAEGEVHRLDGRTYPIGLSTTTFERQAETLPAVTAIFTDISEMKALQELHLRAERLEAVAALSASLAHEIRNPLASIRSSVEQLARSARADADERLLGNLIVRESDRLSRLLSEFLDFSRVRASHFSAVDLHAVALEATNLVRSHPDCGADVRLVVEGERILVEADEDLLHRVVTNLVLNAVQALQGHGAVTVRVTLPSLRDLPTGSDFERPVRLVVEDDGPGIDPDLRDRLFQPFVSGRPGGSGLGLAIVQRAVEAHRGLVLVESAPGSGTRFTIYLHARWRTEESA